MVYFTALWWPGKVMIKKKVMIKHLLNAYYIPDTVRISDLIQICSSLAIDSDCVLADQTNFLNLLTPNKRAENIKIALIIVI